MPYSPTGVFTPEVTFVDGTLATAEDQNTQDQDIASGLTQAMTRAGLAPATANIPMGGFKLTGLGPGSASQDSVTFGQFNTATTVRLFWGGTSGGSANTQTVTLPAGFTPAAGQQVGWVAGFTNTGDTTLNGIRLYQPTSLGPLPLVGGEIEATGLYIATFNPALNSSAGGLQLVAPALASALGSSAITPQGRLTLATATPVMTSTITAAGTVYFTPYLGGKVPVWDGSQFVATAFSELSQALSDATLSPAAAVAASNYDLFIWSHNGTTVVSRGAAWTNATTRGYSLTLSAGILVNAADIANGPKAGYGVYVGTIATDAGGATVSWGLGAAASGGTAGALNVWNYYNRVNVAAKVVDNGTGYTNLPSSFRQARSSAGNQINFVTGLAEDAISAAYVTTIQATNPNSIQVAIGLDSTTAATVTGGYAAVNIAAGYIIISPSCTGFVAPQIGSHYLAAIEAASAAGCTADFLGLNTLSAMFRM